MAQGVFGKAGTISFSATLGPRGEVLAPHALVSFSIYDEAPTDAQKNDDANALADAIQFGTSAWTNSTSSNEKLIAYTAITDPEPLTSTKWRRYFAVIRYRLESGADIIRDVEPLIMHRAEGISSRFGVLAADLTALERKLTDLLTGSQITTKIDLAERLVKQALRSRGMDLRRLEWSDAKDLVRYRACSICCKDLSNDPGDEWHSKADYYMGTYNESLSDLQLGYDADDSGDIEPDETQAASGAVGFLFR